MRPLVAVPLLLAALVGCGGDGSSGEVAAPEDDGPVVVFTDGPEAGFDCLSVHLALAAAVDDEGDEASDYLDGDELRRNGTFGPVVLERMLEDPTPEMLGLFAAVCEKNGYRSP